MQQSNKKASPSLQATQSSLTSPPLQQEQQRMQQQQQQATQQAVAARTAEASKQADKSSPTPAGKAPLAVKLKQGRKQSAHELGADCDRLQTQLEHKPTSPACEQEAAPTSPLTALDKGLVQRLVTEAAEKSKNSPATGERPFRTRAGKKRPAPVGARPATTQAQPHSVPEAPRPTPRRPHDDWESYQQLTDYKRRYSAVARRLRDLDEERETLKQHKRTAAREIYNLELRLYQEDGERKRLKLAGRTLRGGARLGIVPTHKA